jgi:hypothetical protein
MPDAKRHEIKRKVSAAQSRNEARAEPATSDRAGEKAVEAKDRMVAFVRAHPIATVAGGLAVGILVSSVFRGSPTRKAGKAIGRKTAGLAAIVADLAVTYAQQAYEAAEEARRAGAEKVDEWGDALGDGARGLSDGAAGYAASAAAAARKTRKSVGRSIRSRIH